MKLVIYWVISTLYKKATEVMVAGHETKNRVVKCLRPHFKANEVMVAGHEIDNKIAGWLRPHFKEAD